MQTFTLVITDDGQIGIFAQDGTYEQGKANIQAMLAALEAEGIELSELSQIENHRMSPTSTTLHDITHQAQHEH